MKSIRAGYLLLLFVGALIILPLGMLIFGSITTGSPWKPGEFSLNNYVTMFTGVVFFSPLVNTIIFAGAKTALVLLLGLYLAFVVNRTNSPLKSWVNKLIIIPLITPAFLNSIAWIFLLNPRMGVLNTLLQSVLGLKSPPLNIYSMPGLIFVSSFITFPYVYLILSSGFSTMDASLEEAARTCGARTSSIFGTVTLPIMRPVILSAFLMSIIGGFAAFDSPLYIGLPAGIMVFSMEIYTQAMFTPPNYAMATSLSVILLIIALVMVTLQQRAMKNVQRFTTVRGRGLRPTLINLGRWKYVTAFSILILMIIYTFLPLIILVLVSVFPQFSLLTLNWNELTITNYINMFNYPQVGRALINSLWIPALAALIALIIALFTSYYLVKTSLRFKPILENIAMTPTAMPGIVLSMGILWVFVKTPLFGTAWILLVAYLIGGIPHGLRNTLGALVQIHNEVEEASRVTGASWGRTLVEIIGPLMKNALIAGFIVVLIFSANNLAMPILLYFPGSEVVPVVLYDMWENGHFGYVAALGVFFLVMILAIYLVVRKLLKVDVKFG